MTKNELQDIIRDVKDFTNRAAMNDPSTHTVLTAPVAIAVLEDVYSEVADG